MSIDWPAFAQLVHQHQRFLLTSHIRPDCDALGSELGMAQVLRQLGKDVRIVNGHPTPPNLAFIDPDQEVQALSELTNPQVELADREVVIVLDTSAWIQLGPMAEVVRSFSGVRMIVDHHVSEDDLGAFSFKDVTAEATGRLVVDAADALQVPLTPRIARPLFTALATDTGWFRFNSTTAATYRLAARLLEAGVEAAAVYGDLYERDTLGRVHLRGLILSRAQRELEGRLIFSYVEAGDFGRLGALPSDTEDAINLTLAVAGTEVGLIFIEQPEGGVKVSFRSRRHLDCSQMAAHFGGGGHRAASGAFVEGPLPEVRQKVLAYVRQCMDGA